jgi:hypothetical protein
MDKLNLLYQYGAITNAAHELDIEPTDCRQIGGRFAFLFYKNEANRVAARCIIKYGVAPTVIISDMTLPAPGKGLQWIATNESEPTAAAGAASHA